VVSTSAQNRSAVGNEWKAKREKGEPYDPDAGPFGHLVHYEPLIGDDLDEALLQSLKKQDEAISLIQSRTQLQNQTEIQPQTELQPPPPPSATP